MTEAEKLAICSVDECERPKRYRGWCTLHYARWQAHGDPNVVLLQHAGKRGDFWSKVAKGSAEDCWPWLGAQSGDGYGQLKINKIKRPAYRIAYELEVGPIPEGLELDHLCFNRLCCNPAHLEPVTTQENLKRRRPWKRTR